MAFTFMPDFWFDTYDKADADFLKSLGVKGLILDIDNTLEPYENATPGEGVVVWLSSLREAGIACAFVSNNGKERVELFNKELSLPAYYKAKKPFSKNLKRAMTDMGTDKTNTYMMGDQVFTDVLAARFAGLAGAILVNPIKDKTDRLTRFKRWLEKPILKKYERKKGKNPR